MLRPVAALLVAHLAGCVLAGSVPSVVKPPVPASLNSGEDTFCSAPVPRSVAPPLYYPTRVGTKWVYTITTGDDAVPSFDVTDTIEEAKEVEAGRIVTISRTRNASSITEKVLVSRDGLFLVWNPHGEHRPPACLLKLPWKSGEKWESYSLPIKANSGYVNVAGGIETVEVPAGKYKAIRVESYMENDGPRKWLYTHWYSPGIGIVKGKYGYSSGTTVLKAFTLAPE